MSHCSFRISCSLPVPSEDAKVFSTHQHNNSVWVCVDVRISARPRMPLLRRNFGSSTTRQTAFCVLDQETSNEQLSWRRDPAKNSLQKQRMQKTNNGLLVLADGLLQQNVIDYKWHAQLAKFRVHSVSQVIINSFSSIFLIAFKVGFLKSNLSQS